MIEGCESKQLQKEFGNLQENYVCTLVYHVVKVVEFRMKMFGAVS